MWVSVSCEDALGVSVCGLDVEEGSLHLFLIVAYSLSVCVKFFLLHQGVCVCVCVSTGVYLFALTEQVGPLCMGSRQPVRHTADCGQAYCAQHAVCGAGSDTLWWMSMYFQWSIHSFTILWLYFNPAIWSKNRLFIILWYEKNRNSKVNICQEIGKNLMLLS